MTTQVLERPRNQPADPGKQSPTAVMALTDSDERLPSSPRPRRQPKTTTIEYPDSDGKPMAETAIHVRAIMYLYDVFEFLLKTIRADLSIYLAADMFLYYQEGNPRANKSPDLMLIKGVDGSYQRRSFKTWVEHAVPSVIIEVSSKSVTTKPCLTTKAQRHKD
jgi:Uma2 family endonuclease